MELQTLLERCQTGDALAWEALVRQYQGRVLGLARHYVGNQEEARDVAQEIFIRIYRHLDRCTSAEHFLPWMLRIGRNACIDHLRRRKARPPAQDQPIEERYDLASAAPTPEDDWQRDSRKRLVHLALQAMSELNREVLVLREIQGLSIEETAATLNVPLGTVKSRCNRARLELAKKLLALTGGDYESGDVSNA
jgi:RNA polymerase sigma-70 factor (ECF subfamily)